MKSNTNVVSDDIKSDLDTVLQIRVTKKNRYSASKNRTDSKESKRC